MLYHIDQFNGVYHSGCALLLPSRINIVAMFIQSVILFLISGLNCNANTYKLLLTGNDFRSSWF